MSGGHFPAKFPSASEGCAAYFPEMKSSGLPAKAGDMARDVCLFDIVNGFFNRCRGAAPVDGMDPLILTVGRCS